MFEILVFSAERWLYGFSAYCAKNGACFFHNYKYSVDFFDNLHKRLREDREVQKYAKGF